MYSDSHMHTRYSKDSSANPEEMIEAAVKMGLPSICFTDHMDKDYFVDGEEFVFDLQKYFEEMSDLKERYKEQIQIRIGVEIGLQPHLKDYYAELTQKWPFDFVIGSIHVVDGKDPYYPEFFEGKSDAKAYLETMEETIKNIKIFSDFDTLGHLDYVVRYGKNQAKEYAYQTMSDQIDEILRYLIQNGKGLELNTAGLKYGLSFAHPHPDVLKRYQELGGEIITIGSDGHKPEHIGYDFDKIKAILSKCGFKYYTEFIKRKPKFLKI